MANKRQKQIIHIAINNMGISEENYRLMLSGYGVKSSADPSFTYQKAEAFIQELKSMGWNQNQTYGWGKNKYENLRGRKGNWAKPEILRKIEAIWRGIARDPSDKALEKFCKNKTGKDKIIWLTEEDGKKVLIILKEMKKAEGKTA